ncbi:hypothetical protein ACFSGI_10575 [Paenibacillus nicotianae]|uniref:Uncharacterized protein n=1 Tax=Paenibacillus nicotianae TaxID=1526551 RepID=A0ABW4UVH3_9BACL
MNTSDETVLLNFIRDIEPLNFDSALANEYISALNSELKKYEILAEIKEHYEEIYNKKLRIENLKIIDKLNIFFDMEIAEDLDEDIKI